MRSGIARLTALTAACCLAASALAQQPPPPLELPAPPTPESVLAPDSLEPIDSETGFRPLAPLPAPSADDLHLFTPPAPTESSGTWLRRGLWYADLEAIVMSRTWNSNNMTLVGENELPIIEPGSPTTIVGGGNPAGVEGEIGESSAGWDGMPRLTLGRFLFRDQRNRDHTAEIVASGGAEWNEAVSVESVNPNGLFVPDSIDDARDIGFEGASASNFEYSSRLYNFEWNYQVTERMSKDRMELQPSGSWVRKASPGVTRHFIAGLRYVDLEENVDWFASDILNFDPTGGGLLFLADSGDYRVLASNNLFGPQFGAGLTWDNDRWNVSLSGKFGALINDARTTGELAFDNAVIPGDFSTEAHDNTLSYFSQWNLTARYHLRPNLSLRFGWEGLYVTAVALAPNQLSFDPVSTSISVTGDVFYNGITMGTEYFW